MSEITVENVEPVGRGTPARAVRKRSRISSATIAYAFLVAAILAGWMLRDQKLVDPESGLGYWLGIVGASTMLLLLLYPVRKRIRFLRVFGPTKHWFRLHMIFGLVGPLLILYHCNFSLGSFNSRVALFCMLLVAGSGIIGKHFYARIHRGLYGKKLSLSELQRDMTESLESNRGIAALMPNLTSALEVLSLELQGDEITRSLGVGRSLYWSAKQPLVRYKLKRLARIDLAEKSRQSTAIAADEKRLRRVANKYIGDYVDMLARVAQFSFYERMFSLWHVFHLPFFLMLVLSACVHVLAVHMY